MNKKDFLDNIDYLRGMLALLVVVGHAMTIYVGDYAGHKMVTSIVGSNLRSIIYSFHMPAFMAISGYLFYFEIQKGTNFALFVRKKIKRLIIPFIIVFYFWRKPLFFIANTSLYVGMSATQIIKEYLSLRTTGALWFLYVLFLIFIIQKVLINYVWKNNKTVISFFFLLMLANIVSYKFTGPIHHLMLFSVYFFIGNLIHKHNKNLHHFLPLSSIVSLVGTMIILFIRPSGFVGSLISFSTATSDVFILFELSKKFKTVCTKSIKLISGLSMGIYLFHEPLIIAIGSKIPPTIRGGGTCDDFFSNWLNFFHCDNNNFKKIRS